MKFCKIKLFFCFGIFILSHNLYAETITKKRFAPNKVDPVVINHIRYEAIHWGKSRGLEQNGGYIGAYDDNTNKELWLLKIYDVSYENDIENDKQDVFITVLRKKNGHYLLVENEIGQFFIVDLKARFVKIK